MQQHPRIPLAPTSRQRVPGTRVGKSLQPVAYEQSSLLVAGHHRTRMIFGDNKIT